MNAEEEGGPTNQPTDHDDRTGPTREISYEAQVLLEQRNAKPPAVHIQDNGRT